MLFLLILVYLYIVFLYQNAGGTERMDGWIVFYLFLLPLSLISFILYELFYSNKHPFYLLFLHIAGGGIRFTKSIFLGLGGI